jgi:hypothetical protein
MNIYLTQKYVLDLSGSSRGDVHASARKIKVFPEFKVRAPSSKMRFWPRRCRLSCRQKYCCLWLTESVVSRRNWKNWLSASEKNHQAGLKKANLAVDLKVVNCGICQQPGHNRRTCQRVKASLLDKDGQECLMDAVEVSFINYMN